MSDVERANLVADYLQRLGIPREPPSRDLLERIIRAHVATFPFASIGPQLGDDLPLDLPSLHDRIVVRARGGYCFEQNGLLFEVLDHLGFAVTLAMARVIHDQDIHPGLTHRITLVDIDGVRCIADVGFGPQGPPFPVPVDGSVVGEGWRTYRVVERHPGERHLQVLTDSGFFSLYRFDEVRYGPSDAELGHFYSHRHPEAVFVNTLVASRILDDEVRSLRNRDYRVLRDGAESVRAVADAEDLHALLTEDLGLHVTPEEAVRMISVVDARQRKD